MKSKKLLFSGIFIFGACILVGILGTVWGIYSSFDALETAEYTGIEPVGAGIENALIFTVIGLIGAFVGIVLIIAGGIRAYRRSL